MQPNSISRYWQIPRASWGFARPVKSRKSVIIGYLTHAKRFASLKPPHWDREAGEGYRRLGREDSNLRMQVPKTCVLPLDDAPSMDRYREALQRRLVHTRLSTPPVLRPGAAHG